MSSSTSLTGSFKSPKGLNGPLVSLPRLCFLGGTYASLEVWLGFSDARRLGLGDPGRDGKPPEEIVAASSVREGRREEEAERSRDLKLKDAWEFEA
jgi:hypothetical protein